jgi:hypothetical protein
MVRSVLWAASAALLAGGCSILPSLPFTGSSGGPPTTNEAVVACERQAKEQGFENVGQQQVTPAGDGRYVVVLEAEDDLGYTRATCNYDPTTGATLQQTPRKG